MLVLITGLQGTGKSTIADAAAETLRTSVLAHDWAMSGLRPFDEIERALDAMDFLGRRAVGWSLLTSLARAQLRSGRSVVLDGVARPPQITACRILAEEERGSVVVVYTICSDPGLHRSRVEGRMRGIPNWYEFDWQHVERSRRDWIEPQAVDLVLDAANPLEENLAVLTDLLVTSSSDVPSIQSRMRSEP